MNFESIINSILKIIDDVLPDGDKKVLAKLEIAKLSAKLKNPLVVSLLTLMAYLVFQYKAIFVTDYLYSDFFYIDLTLMALVFSFQFGIPFKTLVGTIKDFLNKKRKK